MTPPPQYKHGQKIYIEPVTPVLFAAPEIFTIETTGEVSVASAKIDMQPADTDEQQILNCAKCITLNCTGTNTRNTARITHDGSIILFITISKNCTFTLDLQSTKTAAQSIVIRLEQNSTAAINHTGDTVENYIRYERAHLLAQSTLHSNGIPQVTGYCRVNADTRICERSAYQHYSRINALGQSRYDIGINTDQQGDQSTSIIDARAVAADESKTLLRGKVKIGSDATGSDGNQQLHTLTISDLAEADSIPELDIQNHQVTCSHRASVRGIDPLELFTMQLRGIDPKTAQHMIIEGFLQ